MPQLDLSTYFSSWIITLVLFWILYIIVYNYFLPSFVSILKTRKLIIK